MRERVNIYQVAKRYGKAVSTIYSWLGKGLLPPLHKMGAQSFFYLDEIIEWEDNGCPPAGSDQEKLQCHSVD